MADTIDFKLLERLPTKNPESLRELLHEVEQPVDRRLGEWHGRLSRCLGPREVLVAEHQVVATARTPQQQQQHVRLHASPPRPHSRHTKPYPLCLLLASPVRVCSPGCTAGNVTPLNNTDKEALKQRLDALDQRRLQQHAAVAAAATSGGGAVGVTGPNGCSAPLSTLAPAAKPLQPPAPQPSLSSQWLPALHTAQLHKQKAKAEAKRLTEQQARAQQRSAQVRALW